MANVRFGIPDDVKARFDAAFDGANRNQVIASLVIRAVEEQERRVAAMNRLFANRAKNTIVKDEEIRAAREEGPPLAVRFHDWQVFGRRRC